eukprot:m.197189 g.197189  ORF g.197189 m.197189 type:complete len:834 (-) comp18711_c0_seq1:258-2759(-)
MSDSADDVPEALTEVDPDLEPIENPVLDNDTRGLAEESKEENVIEGNDDIASVSVDQVGNDEEVVAPEESSAEITIGGSDDIIASASTDPVGNNEVSTTDNTIGSSEDIAEESTSQAGSTETAETVDESPSLPDSSNAPDTAAADVVSDSPAEATEATSPSQELSAAVQESETKPSVTKSTSPSQVVAASDSGSSDDSSQHQITHASDSPGEPARDTSVEPGSNENAVPTHESSESAPGVDDRETEIAAHGNTVEVAAPSDPWIIEVNVVNAGAASNIKVHIERSTDRKRWLGGFKHKKNGLEYHNVSTQTYRKARQPDGKVRFTREVQTKQMSSGTTNNQQTVSVTSTQMTGTGCYVATTHDKIIVAKPYFSAAQREAQRLQAVIVLQSYFRRMQAVKFVADLRRRKEEYDTWMAAEELRKQEAEEAEFQSRIDRRLNPKTKDDFQLLYSGLEVWRQEQLGELVGKEGHARTEALNALLHQQCQYLGAIDQLKNLADEENRMDRIKRFFDTTAAPKRWVEPEYGLVVEMETPDTIRARELREVYNGLNFENLENDERMDILLHTKLTVERFDTKVSRELVELIAREGDLLARGTRQANLQGLRKRIRNLFLRLCEDKEFNPEAGKYLAVHKPKDTYQQGLLKCTGTENYLTHDEFVFRDPRHVPFNSKRAKKLQNIATSRKDTTQYRRILEDIRNTEVNKGYHSQVVFLLSVDDIVYILDTIWGGKSVLSQEEEVFRLTLCRWNRDEEWSPWNCILLTGDEAHVHETASKDMELRAMYGEALLRNVQQRHLRARTHFLSLVEVQQARMMQVEDDAATSHALPQSTTTEAVAT